MQTHGRSRRWSALRVAVQATAAVTVSILALVWALHDADLDRMAQNLGRSSPVAVLVFLVGQVAIHAVRVLRWGLYLRPLDPTLSKRAVFAAANLGIAATFFLPLRLGEFVRPMMISRAGMPFGSAVASIVVERIADGLCSVAMFFVFFAFVPEDAPIPDEMTRLSIAAAALFGGGLCFLVVAGLAREPVLGLTRAVLSRLSETLADRVVGLLGTFLGGLAALGSTRRAAAYGALTVAYWVGSGLLVWLLAASYRPELPVVSGLFTIAVLVFAVMIPAGPAFAGTFEVGFRLGFGAFGLDPSTVIVVAVLAHVVQILVMAALVGLGLAAAEPEQRGGQRSGPSAEG